MSLIDDAPLGHFDRERTLLPLLESYETPQPEAMTLEEFTALDAAAKAAFNDRRVDRIAGNTDILTPDLKDLLREVRRASLRMSRAVGRTSVMVSGPPTAGKTTAAKHVMVDALRRHERQHPEWRTLGHSPIVYVETPSSCTPKNLMGRFLTFLGIRFTAHTTVEERTKLVTDALIRRRTSLIVIDEMQNMAFTGRGHSETQQATKNLMNAVPAVPLYLGFNLEQKLHSDKGLGEQFAARSTLVRLNHFGRDTADERKLWGAIVYAFESQLGLLAQTPKSLPAAHADYLWSRTRGSLSALSRLLTTVALDLIDAGDPTQEFIIREHMDTVRLDLTSEREYEREGKRKSRAKKATAHAA